MDFKSELLKSIWYAFTSLDAEHCGKVSKSQLKVRQSVTRENLVRIEVVLFASLNVNIGVRICCVHFKRRSLHYGSSASLSVQLNFSNAISAKISLRQASFEGDSMCYMHSMHCRLCCL